MFKSLLIWALPKKILNNLYNTWFTLTIRRTNNDFWVTGYRNNKDSWIYSNKNKSLLKSLWILFVTVFDEKRDSNYTYWQ